VRTGAIAVLWLLLGLVACGKEQSTGRMAFAEQTAAPAPGASTRYMAYEHHVQIDTGEGEVLATYESAIAACAEASAELCVVLQSAINSGRNNSASLRFRAKAAGIQKILQVLGSSGEIVSRSTTAEDLAGPIEDSARQLEMLKDYRARLEGLRVRANNDVESLIKVSKELAEVQRQIEALTGDSARLNERVTTEILNVTIQSSSQLSFWRPIAEAFRDFGAHLSRGIASTVTVTAYLLPWTIVLVILGWVVRRLWRGLRRARAAGS
jgi:hypothetical protein